MKRFRYLLILCVASVVGFSVHAMPIGMRIAMMGRAAERKQMVEATKELKAGEYFKATLAELGYDVPTNGTPYEVKALGLPAGLKLKYNTAVTKKDKKGKKVVVKKAKVEWWIEGVPTAAMDFFTNPPYLVIAAGTAAPQIEPLPVEVVAQKMTDLGELALGQSVNTNGWLTGVGAGWAVSGLPTGLKYTAKLLTTKKKVGKKTVVTTNALPYSVYGKTTKAGLFTITAKKKVGAYYETMKYRVLVRPAVVDAALFGEDLTNLVTMAYVPVAWDLTGSGEAATSAALPLVAAVGGKVAKVTGLPTGLSFAAVDTYAYANAKKKTGKYLKQAGQTIVGTPTKPGTFVVTFTKNVTTGTGKKKKTVAKTAQILWKVEPNDVEVNLGFNEAGGVVESGVVGLNYGDLLAFSATSNATVTASGLPAGIKLVKVADGRYAFTGYTTKAGTYLVTVKATLKGKTVTQRLALQVEGLPAWAKGTFNGVVSATGETPVPGDAQEARSTNGLATVTVSAVGKISGKFQELGTNWTFSAASYTAATSAAAPAGGDSGGAATSAAAPAGGVSGGAAGGDSAGFVCSNVVAKYAYKVKSGKKTVTRYLERTFHLAVSPVPIVSSVPNVPNVPDTPIRGVVQMVEAGEAGTAVEAWQNLWGQADYKALGKRLFTSKSGKKTLNYKAFNVEVCTNDLGQVVYVKAGDDKTGLASFATLSLTVTTAGAVTATLTYDTGKTKKDPKTKKTVKVIYKATCPSVVVPQVAADAEPFAGEVPLYFAPSAGNGFEGFAGSVVVP